MAVRGCLFAGVVALVTSAMPVAAQEQVGRYTIVLSQTNRGDTFLLDTVTGQIWRQVKFGDVLVWHFMYKLDNVAQTEALIESLPIVKPPKPTEP
jgi:ABC-type sugar transport system substrate-binding protein